MRARFSLATLFMLTTLACSIFAIVRNNVYHESHIIPPLLSQGWNESTTAFQVEYNLHVDMDQIDRTPTWNYTSPNPPVSTLKAIEIAHSSLSRMIKAQLLEDPQSGEWTFSNARLIPGGNLPNKWYWVISFQYLMDQTGPPCEVEFAILMDQTVIQPVRIVK